MINPQITQITQITQRARRKIRAVMETMTDSQELARRFNEDEAVWQGYERKRRRRRPQAESPLLYEVLDELDWIAAEREGREVRCVATTVEECWRNTEDRFRADLNAGP